MTKTITQPLPEQFNAEDNTFSLVKRSPKAAIFKRETLEGKFVSYEVFGIISKDGIEYYPNAIAFKNNWAYCPISLDRAQVWFDRFTNGDCVVPDVDPETGTIIALENDPSLAEMMAEPEIAQTPISLEEVPAEAVVETVAEIVETVPVVEQSNPLDLDPETVEIDIPVEAEAEAAAVDVKPTKVKKEKVVKAPKVEKEPVIPTGEFTQAQFAVANGLPLRGVVWSRLDALVHAGKLKKELRPVAKGRPTAFFVGV